MNADAKQTTAPSNEELARWLSCWRDTASGIIEGEVPDALFGLRLIAHVDALAAQNGALAAALREFYDACWSDEDEEKSGSELTEGVPTTATIEGEMLLRTRALLSGQPVDTEAERLEAENKGLRSVLLKDMRCHHEYEGADNTSRIICRKCGLVTTVEALAGFYRA